MESIQGPVVDVGVSGGPHKSPFGAACQNGKGDIFEAQVDVIRVFVVGLHSYQNFVEYLQQSTLNLWKEGKKVCKITGFRCCHFGY